MVIMEWKDYRDIIFKFKRMQQIKNSKLKIENEYAFFYYEGYLIEFRKSPKGFLELRIYENVGLETEKEIYKDSPNFFFNIAFYENKLDPTLFDSIKYNINKKLRKYR